MLTHALLVAVVALQAPPPGLDSLLRQGLGFAERDVAQVVAGGVVTRTLDRASGEEVALVGVTRVRLSARAFVERFRRVETFLPRRELVQVGRFGTPPTAGDLAPFRVPAADREPLRTCRPGKCVLKLPAAVTGRLQAIDWNAPGADSAAADAWRGWLLDYARGYVARGNAALVVYDDAQRPLPLHTGFHELLAESAPLLAGAPGFHHYLDEFPSAPRPAGGVEDVLYWSTEDAGLRPVTGLTHASVLRTPPPAAGPGALIALKQIYASHYFHAALTVIALVDDPRSPGDPGAYVVYVERSLFDTPLGGLLRRRVEGRLRGGLQSRLEAMRRDLR